MFGSLRGRSAVPRLAFFLLCGLSITSLFFLYHGLGVSKALLRPFQELRTAPTMDRQRRTAIPAIVHFVQLKQEPTSLLHFPFEDFLALYAAHLHIHPTVIYIHHDFSDEEIAHAVQHGSSWTKKVLTAFPSVKLNRVTAPTQANGHTIARVEHRSDFVRLEQLQRHGGVYLDWDVVTLRPLAPLRHAGYRAVVGRQFDTFVNNGIILAAPQSAVVRILHAEAQRVFDGGWITHSVELLTRVANRLAAAPAEVLIMDYKAFSPFSWEQHSVDHLLRRHMGDADAAAAVPSPPALDSDLGRLVEPLDVDALWKTRAVAATNTGPKAAAAAGVPEKTWVYDLSDALFIHKIFNSVDSPPGYTGVNVPYILARDSNYAIATWAIVMEGIKAGLIDVQDHTY